MAKTLEILTLVGLVLGALAALVVSGSGLLLLGVYGLVVAVFFFLTRDAATMAAAGLVVLVSILTILGSLGAVSTEGTDIDFGISPELAHALAVTTMAFLGAALLARTWRGLEPQWATITVAVALAIAFILAFVGQNNLGNLASPLNWVAAIALLGAASHPARLMMEDE